MYETNLLFGERKGGQLDGKGERDDGISIRVRNTDAFEAAVDGLHSMVVFLV